MHDPDYVARKDLARANRRFYQVFERLDLEGMRALWLDAPTIRCVHPGGEALVGPARVHASWSAIFHSTDAIRFDVTDLTIEVAGEMGIVGCIEHIRGADAPQDDDSVAAATNVFVRRGGEWRMAVHHASPVARRFFVD